ILRRRFRLWWSGRIRRERCASVGSVEFRPLGDPPLDQRDLLSGEWIGFLRHASVGVVASNQRNDFALFRFPGRDRRTLRIARLLQEGKRADLKPALRLGRPMTGLALFDKNRRYLVFEADRFFRPRRRKRQQRGGSEHDR